MKIIWHTVAPLLAPACTACGLESGSVCVTQRRHSRVQRHPLPMRQGSPAPTRTSPPRAKTKPPPLATLRRGGREVFPRYRLVGYAGADRCPTWPARDRSLDKRGRRDRSAGEAVRRGAGNLAGGRGDRHCRGQRSPGRESQVPGAASPMPQIGGPISRLPARHRAVMLLNLGLPGRSEFITEARHSRSGSKNTRRRVVALDPEWAMDRGQRPGECTGT